MIELNMDKLFGDW